MANLEHVFSRKNPTSEESYKDDQLGEVGLDQRAAAAVFVGDEVMRQILLSPSI